MRSNLTKRWPTLQADDNVVFLADSSDKQNVLCTDLFDVRDDGGHVEVSNVLAYFRADVLKIDGQLLQANPLHNTGLSTITLKRQQVYHVKIGGASSRSASAPPVSAPPPPPPVGLMDIIAPLRFAYWVFSEGSRKLDEHMKEGLCKECSSTEKLLHAE